MTEKIEAVSLAGNPVFVVRASVVMPREKYHAIRANVEDDLRHAGIENPRVIVWPPDMQVLAISGDGA